MRSDVDNLPTSRMHHLMPTVRYKESTRLGTDSVPHLMMHERQYLFDTPLILYGIPVQILYSSIFTVSSSSCCLSGQVIRRSNYRNMFGEDNQKIFLQYGTKPNSIDRKMHQSASNQDQIVGVVST